VLKDGAAPGAGAAVAAPGWARDTVRIVPLDEAALRVAAGEGMVRVIGVVPGQIVTKSLTGRPAVRGGLAEATIEGDLAKVAVVERHTASGRTAVAFVHGFGLRRGAIASTIAHDAHNVVCVGMGDADMARAIGRLAELGGGRVAVCDGQVLAELPLPVAGLLSDRPLAGVLEATGRLDAAARDLGSPLPAPFHTMSFLSLSVIPELKITDRGLVDVDRFELTDLTAGAGD
jgi:adenine deaminase